MKVRDVLSCVGFGTQVALYDRHCKPICSRLSMPSSVSDLDGYNFLDYDVLVIDCCFTLKCVPVLVISVNISILDQGV